MFEWRMVVHFLDGRTLQAYGDDFLPWEQEILVKDTADKIISIALKEVKVVCFVKEFGGDRKAHHAPPGKMLYFAVPGNPVEIRFSDGEVLYGVATVETLPKPGFFVTPLNPNSNNQSVYVNSSALKQFKVLPR